MITPVQRLPRYELLLRDLVKNTAKNHPDYPNLTFALEKMTEINVFINEQQRDSEQIQHFLNFQVY